MAERAVLRAWGVGHVCFGELWGVYRGGMRGLRPGNTGGMGVVWPVAVWGVWGGVWVGGSGGVRRCGVQ